jgi:hypothetical protein
VLWAAYDELGRDASALRAYAIRDGERGYWSSFITPAQARAQVAKPTTVKCGLCAGTGTRPSDEHWQAGSTWAQQCGGCNACQGTGQAHNPDRLEGWRPEDSDNLVSSGGDDYGTEWAYVIGDDGLAVYERRYGAPEADGGHGTGMFGTGASGAGGGYWWHLGTFSWDGLEPNWGYLERALAS